MKKNSVCLKNTYTIKEVSDMLGISPHTLRNWEKYGLIKYEKNADNNYRQFSFGNIQEIREINCLRNLNVNYNDIRRLGSIGLSKAEELYDSIKKSIDTKIELMLSNKKHIVGQLNCIKEINWLQNHGFMREAPYFKQALSFELGAVNTSIWFKKGDAVSVHYFDDFKRTDRTTRGVICQPHYKYKKEDLIWQYDPTKTYIAYLDTLHYLDKANRIFDVDQVLKEMGENEQKIIDLGYKPFRSISICLDALSEYGYFKCWMECEPYRADAYAEQRPPKTIPEL